ncbi:MAG: MFS transporter [Chloroflexota bacterium]|nr:MFS transporter [Chloroflexota bacterium]
MARTTPVGENDPTDAEAGADASSPRRVIPAPSDGADAPADTEDGAAEAEPHPTDADRGSAFGALASKPFARYWPALTLSLTGVWVRITVIGYLVYELTDDEFKLGLISFAQAAPVLVAAPIAGALLDRIDRRRVLLAVSLVNLVAMVAVGTLVLTDAIRYWHLVVAAIVTGTASGFDWPARLSLVPSLVPRHRLQSAVALNAAAFNGSRIIGPMIGGFLAAWAGLALPFFFTAAAYVPFAIILLTMGVATAAKGGERGSPLANLMAGYRYIWRTPTIRGLLSVDVVPLALGVSYFTMAPAIVRDVLGLGERGLGLLLAANGIGSLAGTLLVALVAGARRRGRIVVVGVACFGVMLIAFASSSNLYLSLVLILGLGLVVSTYATMNDTLVQSLVDDAYRGRVLSVYTMLWGLTPIGGLEAGFLADYVGVQRALAFNGLLVLAYVPVLWFLTPLRHID